MSPRDYHIKTYDLSELPHVSPKRLEKLRLAAEGYNHKEIAKMLGIAHITVRNEFRNMFRMYDCKNRVQLVSKAKDIGII